MDKATNSYTSKVNVDNLLPNVEGKDEEKFANPMSRVYERLPTKVPVNDSIQSSTRLGLVYMTSRGIGGNHFALINNVLVNELL